MQLSVIIPSWKDPLLIKTIDSLLQTSELGEIAVYFGMSSAVLVWNEVHYIYRTTHLLTGKYYIGCRTAKTLDDSDYLGSGIWIKRAVKKYGFADFRKDILVVCNNKALKFLLEKAIVNDETLSDPLCMNFKLGGISGELNQESKKKISLANTGKRRTEEQKEKMRGRVPWNKGKKGLQTSWNKGLTWSDESRKKLSEARVGKYSGENNPMFGKKRADLAERNKLGLTRGRTFSEEHKRKIAEAVSGAQNGMWGKEPPNKKKRDNLHDY